MYICRYVLAIVLLGLKIYICVQGRLRWEVAVAASHYIRVCSIMVSFLPNPDISGDSTVLNMNIFEIK